MSGSGRKRSSKWDLKEERQHSLENVRESFRPVKAGLSYRDRELERGWFPPDVAGRNGNKWSVMESNEMIKSKHRSPSREPLPVNRGSYKSDGIDVDSMKMSPGFDDWRQQNRRHSPKSDWNRTRRSRSRSWSRSRSPSRSQSQSPIRGFRRQSGFHEKGRIRSGVSTQLCKDFGVGRCRRGSQCPFLHHEIQSHEDSWDNKRRKSVATKHFVPNDSKEFIMKGERSTNCCTEYLKGNCRRGASCRFVHDGASDVFGRGSMNEVTSERDIRNRDASPEGRVEQAPRRNTDIPCKFFAAGSCRKGKYCRFSHHVQARISPERRSRDDRREQGSNVEDMDKLWDAPKLSDADASNGVKRPWSEPKWTDTDTVNDAEKSWNGPKWSDTNTYIEAVKLTEEKNGQMGDSGPRISGWSTDHRLDHGSDINGALSEPKVSRVTVDSNKKEALQRKMENASVNVGHSEPRGTNELLVDMEMSPEWNYTIRPSNNALKQESLSTHEQATSKEASSWMPDGSSVLQPISIENSNVQHENITREGAAVALPYEGKNIIGNSAASLIDLNSANGVPGQSFGQNYPSSSSVPYSSLNAVGHGKPVISSQSSGGSVNDPQNLVLLHEATLNSKLNVGVANLAQVTSGTPPTQNMVSNEQLTQLTDLSASLAQLLGNGQQLPHLSAALNLHNAMQVPSFANSGGPVQPPSEATLNSNQDIPLHKQYGPISDSMESTKRDMSNKPPGFSLNSAGQIGITDGKLEVLSNKLLPSFAARPNSGENHNNQSSEKEHNLEPGRISEVMKAENGEGAEETKKIQEPNKGGLLENIDGDVKADESKKSKDSKGVRAFKFALVEFVKDLLKPAWKEGQISKEAYKNIVKKAVDKVTSTMQGTNIPQTQEKIDQYLSSSKPKLSKLVQAYVEKFQKAN
ncbi:hypothetical protein SLEP1_g27778 [Rubroshorea leprosula]|uniref:C3H1-type domain-containing protein n=1 Tax=Rubroshorea leprosula TaxID=152421 RepID=A0AAV5JU74_9ROSI|nr:hypothetical protein SLEP1_g27778 [Rubroshorea leprosula]